MPMWVYLGKVKGATQASQVRPEGTSAGEACAQVTVSSVHVA